MKISLTDKQRQQLRLLGFKDEEMTAELLVNIKLYQQALNGSVSAANAIKSILNDTEEENGTKAEDLSNEIKKEEVKIKKQLSSLPDNVLAVNKELIHNVAFQSVTLKYLSNDIAKNGIKEKYKNGANQWGYKDRTEVKTYNNMMKSYQSCMKQLNDLLYSNCEYNDGFEDDEL